MLRNFIIRTISGIFFVAALVGCIIGHPLAFGALFALITGMALWEFSGLVNAHAGAAVNRLINTIGGVYLFVAFYYYASGWVSGRADVMVFVPVLVALVYLPISELFLQHSDPLKNWAYAFASWLYIALPFSLLSVLAFSYNPMTDTVDYLWQIPLSIFIFLWANDSGAYCVGCLLHKYFPAKLFERVSPKKTWVGSIGGALCCLAVAAVLHHFFQTVLPLTLWHWMGFGAVVCVFGTFGDLVESLFKRQLNVKDSGRMLPGHGGVLDRFDSALLAIPATVIYFYTINMF